MGVWAVLRSLRVFIAIFFTGHDKLTALDCRSKVLTKYPHPRWRRERPGVAGDEHAETSERRGHGEATAGVMLDGDGERASSSSLGPPVGAAWSGSALAIAALPLEGSSQGGSSRSLKAGRKTELLLQLPGCSVVEPSKRAESALPAASVPVPATAPRCTDEDGRGGSDTGGVTGGGGGGGAPAKRGGVVGVGPPPERAKDGTGAACGGCEGVPTADTAPPLCCDSGERDSVRSTDVSKVEWVRLRERLSGGGCGCGCGAAVKGEGAGGGVGGAGGRPEAGAKTLAAPGTTGTTAPATGATEPVRMERARARSSSAR